MEGITAFFIPLFFVFFGTGTVVLFSKRSFGEILPVFLMGSSLVLIIFGLLGNLILGVYILLFFSAVFPILLIAFRTSPSLPVIANFLPGENKRFEIREFSKRYFAPTFFIMFLAYIFLFFVHKNRVFTNWDEFMHWGPMVKEMFRLNDFYSIPESVLVHHKDYPPIVPLFEYLWCKIGRAYSEPAMYHSLHFMMLSFFMPAFTFFRRSKKNYLKLLLSLVFILEIVVIFNYEFHKTVYIDSFLGILIAYGIAIVLFEKKLSVFAITRLIIFFSFLLLTKQIAIIFFLLIMCVLIVNQFILFEGNGIKDKVRTIRKYISNRKHFFIWCSTLLLLIAIPLIFRGVWEYYVDSNGIERQFSTAGITLKNIYDVLINGNGTPVQMATLTNFLEFIMKSPVTTFSFFNYSIGLTCWQVFIAFSIMFVFLGVLSKGVFKRAQIAAAGIILMLGNIAYIFTMLLLYLFSFDDYEAPILASIERYLNTYNTALLVLGVMMFVFIMWKKSFNPFRSPEVDVKRNQLKRKGFFLLQLTVCLFLIASLYKTGAELVRHKESRSTQYIADVERVKNYTDPDGDIFIVTTDSFAYIYLIYQITPQRIDNYFGILSKEVSVEEWMNTLFERDYEYLYLQEVSQEFLDTYSSVFEPDQEITNGQIYKIERNDERIKKFLLLN